MRYTLLLLLVIGCQTSWAPGDTVVPVLHESAPTVWQAGWEDRVREAVDRWNAVLCFDVFVIDDGGTPFVLHARDAWPYGQTIGYMPNHTVHVRGPDPEQELGLIVDVLLHEMGHLIGLEHTAEPGSVMNTQAGGLLTFSQRDIERAREAVGCA